MRRGRLGGVRGGRRQFRWRRGTRRNAWLRGGLVLLALVSGFTGGSALLEPRAFFFRFPRPGQNWVAQLPPFNEHLVVDVGAFFLAFAVLFVWAAIALDARLTRASLVAWLVFSIPHLIFHVSHTARFDALDRTLQTAALALTVAVPLVLLALTRERRRSGLGI
ncbi:MAG: hypothetical protein ACRDJ5_05970 [Actinomycetota bacterium]